MRRQTLLRSLQLRCPRCGGGPLFAGLFRMHDHCPQCGLRYAPEPGFYLGSIYINYGFTVVGTGLLYALLVPGLGVSQQTALTACLVAAVVFPVWFFRYARSFLLALDTSVNLHQGREAAGDASRVTGDSEPLGGTRLQALKTDDATAGCMMGVALAMILLFGILMAIVTLFYSGVFSPSDVPPEEQLDLTLDRVESPDRLSCRGVFPTADPESPIPCSTPSPKPRPATC